MTFHKHFATWVDHITTSQQWVNSPQQLFPLQHPRMQAETDRLTLRKERWVQQPSQAAPPGSVQVFKTKNTSRILVSLWLFLTFDLQRHREEGDPFSWEVSESLIQCSFRSSWEKKTPGSLQPTPCLKILESVDLRGESPQCIYSLMDLFIFATSTSHMFVHLKHDISPYLFLLSSSPSSK